MTMRHPALLVLGLLIASQPRLAAQWSLAVEATASSYGGTSRDGGADPTAFRPHHPTSVGLRVDRRVGGVAVGGGAAPAGGGFIARNSRGRALPQDAPGLFRAARHVAPLGLAGIAVPALKRERPGAPRAVSSDRAAVTRRSASCAAARSACA